LIYESSDKLWELPTACHFLNQPNSNMVQTENDKSLLRETSIKRNCKNEFEMLAKWFEDYDKTDYPGRFQTAQYFSYKERFAELQLQNISTNGKTPDLEEIPYSEDLPPFIPVIAVTSHRMRPRRRKARRVGTVQRTSERTTQLTIFA
jgi:hypothetical protein